MTAPLLDLVGVHACYGTVPVLQGVSLSVAAGSVLSLLGRNGAGKTTTLKTIMGILAPHQGRIAFDGVPIAGEAPYRIARRGLGYVPETRAIFRSLSVRENLTVAARSAPGGAGEAWTLERIFEVFPRLRERRDSGGATLSGGEQQMLSIARALVTNPRLLLLDEPTEGLAPMAIAEIEAVLRRLKATGLAILLIEQNLSFALGLGDAVAVLGKGQIRWAGAPGDFDLAHEVQQRWLGI